MANYRWPAGARRAVEPGQRFAQAGQIARPGIAQGDAPGDTLDVGNPLEFAAHLAGHPAVVVEQCLDGAVAGGGNVALAQRVVQGVAQQARTHAGHAVVEQRKKRRRRLAAQGLGQFQIAPGGEVEAEIGAFEFHGQRPQMRQFARLRGLRVLQQRAGGGDRRPQAFRAEAGQRGDLELLAKQASGRVEFEMPVRLPGARCFAAEVRRPRFRMEDFGRANALQRGLNLLDRDLGAG